MRSERRGIRVVVAMRMRRLLLLALVGAAAWLVRIPSALAQVEEDQPLIPQAISELDVEMRGRYCRQWKKEDGTLVLQFTGGFRLDMGQRRLSANDAVIWIVPQHNESDNRKYYDLTVYLSDNAEVQEPGGTLTQDHVLLVSNLRTFGRIAKYHDAHAPEPIEDSALYQRAIHDRALIESGVPTTQPATSVEVTRPSDAAAARAKQPPRVVRYSLPNIEPAQTPDGERVFISSGRVYFSQSGGVNEPVLEIQANYAVVFPAEGAAGSILGQLEGGSRKREPGEEAKGDAVQGEKDKAAGEQAGDAPSERPGDAPQGEKGGGLPGTGDQLSQRIRAVYLEGDVTLSLGDRFVRAERLYYDFEHDRALILDAVFRVEMPDRGVPLYVRAAEVRQLSANEFLATNAKVTTSEFYTPHYHIGAERIVITDRTTRSTAGSPSGPIRGTYEMKTTTFNVLGMPLAYWPYSKGDFEASETALRSFRTSYNSHNGMEIETGWHVFNLLGMERPPGYDATLRMDYYSKRGPGIGLNGDYERQDYYGLWRTYYINDHGEDNLGPLAQNTPPSDNRGRALFRHRHYLPNDWEATLEMSYISDPNYLREWDPDEFNNGKEQETLIYLKRARDVEAITLLANWRQLDWLTQTEHLPDLTYRRIGDTFADPLVLYHESRVGDVRYRPDDRNYIQESNITNTGLTDVTFRNDVRQEAELPLKLGPLNTAPFASVRSTYWDGQPMAAGGLWRGLGVYGVRGGTIFSRAFDDVHSQLFDIDRIRHIVQPDFAVWYANGNVKSDQINPFDYGIETINAFYGATFGVNQTWQTKRGAGDKRRTVDLLTLNLSAGFFGGPDAPNDVSDGYANPYRPENSWVRNYIAAESIYRLSDTTSLLYDMNYDVNDGTLDQNNISLAVERLPRTSYIFGYRHAGDIHMDVIGGGFNYKLTEKYIVASRMWFDLGEGELGEVGFAIIRKLPRWYCSVNFDYDQVDDDYSINFSLWPEGAVNWAIGSRRYSKVSESTGISP